MYYILGIYCDVFYISSRPYWEDKMRTGIKKRLEILYMSPRVVTKKQQVKCFPSLLLLHKSWDTTRRNLKALKKSASKSKKCRTLSDSTLIPPILPHHYRTGAISTDRPKSPRRNTHIYVTTALSSRRCSSQDLLTVFNMACIWKIPVISYNLMGCRWARFKLLGQKIRPKIAVLSNIAGTPGRWE